MAGGVSVLAGAAQRRGWACGAPGRFVALARTRGSGRSFSASRAEAGGRSGRPRGVSVAVITGFAATGPRPSPGKRYVGGGSCRRILTIVLASVAKQSSASYGASGLLRCARNDEREGRPFSASPAEAGVQLGKSRGVSVAVITGFAATGPRPPPGKRYVGGGSCRRILTLVLASVAKQSSASYGGSGLLRCARKDEREQRPFSTSPAEAGGQSGRFRGVSVAVITSFAATGARPFPGRAMPLRSGRAAVTAYGPVRRGSVALRTRRDRGRVEWCRAGARGR